MTFRLRNRAPSPADDINAGYASGNIWCHENVVYLCTHNAPANAIWRHLSNAAMFPVEATARAPVAAYGTRLLAAAYNGPAIQVVRASDSTIADIGFVTDGSLDTAHLNSFLTDTTGSISIWYDQSGNGLHAEQHDIASRPTITSLNLIGNSHSIVFDPGNGSDPPPVGFVLPPGVAGATNAMSVLTVSRFASASKSAALFQLNGVDGARNLWMGNTSSGSCVYWGCTPGSSVSVRSRAAQTPSVSGLILGDSGPGAIRLINGPAIFNHAGIGSSALSGGTLGFASSTNTRGFVELSAVLIYAYALDEAGQDDACGSLCCHFGLTPQARDVLLFAGDSITDGFGTSSLQSYPRQLEQLLDPEALIYNIGSFGQTITTLSGKDFNFRTQHLPIAKAAGNILVITAGSNDINRGTSAETAYGYLSDYVARAKDAGWTVAIGTMLPRGDLSDTAHAEWLLYNNMIRTGWPSIADALIDFQADVEIGRFANTANRTLFRDKTHPAYAGYARMARCAAASLKPLLDTLTLNREATQTPALQAAPTAIAAQVSPDAGDINRCRYKYSIVACGRWEERDIVEWVQYHRSVGFDHIYFYSNEEDPMPSFRVLTPFLFDPEPFVTFRHYPKRDPAQLQQHDIYLHFMRNDKKDTEWFSMLDIDEFFVFKDSNNVKIFMQSFEKDFDCVYFNWLVHGYNGKPERDSESILLSHTRRAGNIDPHTKMLTRSSIISEPMLGEQYYKTRKTFYHFWNYYNIPGLRATNVLGDDVQRYGEEFPKWALGYVRGRGVSERMIATAYVAHFQFKSEADFVRRIKRGGTTTVAYWKKVLEDGSYQKQLAHGDAVMEVYLARYWLDHIGDAYNFVVEQPVAIPDYPNIALRKPTHQSSVHRPAADDPPNAAVVGHGNNGIRLGTYGFATNHEDSPWWMVDFLDIFEIVEVHIYNRVDSSEFAARANRIVIDVSGDAVGWTRIFALDGAASFGGIGSAPLVIKPDIHPTARYLRISSARPTILHLDEIEVYGCPCQTPKP